MKKLTTNSKLIGCLMGLLTSSLKKHVFYN